MVQKLRVGVETTRARKKESRKKRHNNNDDDESLSRVSGCWRANVFPPFCVMLCNLRVCVARTLKQKLSKLMILQPTAAAAAARADLIFRLLSGTRRRRVVRSPAGGRRVLLCSCFGNHQSLLVVYKLAGCLLANESSFGRPNSAPTEAQSFSPPPPPFDPRQKKTNSLGFVCICASK